MVKFCCGDRLISCRAIQEADRGWSVAIFTNQQVTELPSTIWNGTWEEYRNFEHQFSRRPNRSYRMADNLRQLRPPARANLPYYRGAAPGGSIQLRTWRSSLQVFLNKGYRRNDQRRYRGSNLDELFDAHPYRQGQRYLALRTLFEGLIVA